MSSLIVFMERNLVMSSCRLTPFFPTKAGRQYVSRLIPTMLVYILFVFTARWTFQHLHPTGLMVYLLAILPALPLVGSIAIVGLYIAEESDEFERSILIQSMLWGFGVALAIGTIWGSLEDFANVPHRSAFYAYFSFCIVNGISQPLIRLRYR
jgi:hypothetical protein